MSDIIADLRDIRVTGDPDKWNTLNRAIAEIERLRASQFRWIPVSERKPEPHEFGSLGRVLLRESGTAYGSRITTQFDPVISWDKYTHWASIPPLPEKSQEKKESDRIQILEDRLNLLEDKLAEIHPDMK